MATLTLDQRIINQVSGADNARVCRALEALDRGDMQITWRECSPDRLSADVESYTVQGKKNPVESIQTYGVFLTPTMSECSCPDRQHRGTICKHLIVLVMAAQSLGVETEEKKAA